MEELALVVLTGIITRYNPEDYTGVLLCGKEAAAMRTPWIALDIEGRGDVWQCGSKALLYLDGYPPMVVTVLDSGPFGRYCVRQRDGTCPGIVGDMPSQFAPFAPDLSVRAAVVVGDRIPQERLTQ